MWQAFYPMRAKKLFFSLLILALTQCAQTPASPTPRPTRAPVSPELAVQYALDALHTDSATGYLIGEPTELRGQTMSLADAFARVNGKPLDEKSPLALRRDKLVWLVVTRGDWVLHIPGGHGDPRQRTPTVLSKDVTVHDLWNAIYFDAVTGQVYEQGGIVETQRAQMEKLPLLAALRRTP